MELLNLEKTKEGKLILKIDASLIKESACERRLWYMLCRGLRKRNSNHKMEYGPAVHKAVEGQQQKPQGGRAMSGLRKIANQGVTPVTASMGA